MYRNHFRWLETADEYLEYWGYPAQGQWKIYGLDLPDTGVRKDLSPECRTVIPPIQGAAELQKGAK